jgi:hypothetical protein
MYESMRAPAVMLSSEVFGKVFALHITLTLMCWPILPPDELRV